MRKASPILALTVFAFAAALVASANAEDKKTLTVTAVTHESRVNERVTYHTTPGQSTTDCAGTGTDSGAGTTRINMDCNTTSTPARTTPIATRTTEVPDCGARPGWPSECARQGEEARKAACCRRCPQDRPATATGRIVERSLL